MQLKRKLSFRAGGPACKQLRPSHLPSDQSAAATADGVDHPVLRRLYPNLLTLRQYLLSQLPRTSKNRRRRIGQLGQPIAAQDAISAPALDVELGKLLDTVVIGTWSRAGTESEEQVARERNQDIDVFTQQRSQASASGTFKPGYLLQAEIVDFVVWRLFRRSTSHKPSHLLCHGFQRSGGPGLARPVGANLASPVPGLATRHHNDSVQTLKSPLWCRLHALLGQGGDQVMMDLLLEGSIFLPVEKNIGNYYQLSGVPISELKSEPVCKDSSLSNKVPTAAPQKPSHLMSEDRTPGTIIFVRSRMLYSKAALNASGGVRFGMRHIHVLNRFPKRDDKEQTVHIMRYIFPRQFGLHNVFTSKVDPRETAMPFKDYTLREKEIHQNMCKSLGDKSANAEEMSKWKLRIPKRLRSPALTLVEKLRTLHHRCSYVELLRHYCPIEGVPLNMKPDPKQNSLQATKMVPPVYGPGQLNHTEGEHRATDQPVQQTSFTDMACPTAHVSAFCRAAASKVIPHRFWGNDDNQRVVMFWIDQFISLRKFESLTLHQVTQKLQITPIAWLQMPGQDNAAKLSKSDFDKRKEILLELVYWIFDSFLVPLIRSNFHVTESNVHRNRLFYFRHDVWRMLTEPALKTLRVNMFEEMPTDQMIRVLSSRQLGFTKIRLLPKKYGFRTIMNLKRRQQIMRNGTMSLGRSINSVITPVFNAITYEKSVQPERFGSSLFSVGDMLPKLTAFKNSLGEQNASNQSLYFAKVDVQSCFDTIPQSRLLSMIDELMSLQVYETGKHVELSPLGVLQRLDGQHVQPMPLKRYIAHSEAGTDTASFGEMVLDKFVGAKSNTIFVNTNLQRSETKEELMQLLREHVQRNTVKIGKRFYRQKVGIPQGSVLSSILCNFFYAELERDVLDFTSREDSLLLRLLDDFLLITTDRETAKRFVRVMHRGHPNYGVIIEAAKSLANFDVRTEDERQIPRHATETTFPYCGVCINTTTLEVSKKTDRQVQTAVEDSLTIDLSKIPGQSFHRKALNAFKIQLKNMFIDTSLNSVATIFMNLHQSFYEAAVRCLEYTRALSKFKTTSSSLLIKTVENIIALAFVMLRRHSRMGINEKRKFAQIFVSRQHLQWLACKAFQAVFERKQTQHRALVKWLKASLATIRVSNTLEMELLKASIVRH